MSVLRFALTFSRSQSFHLGTVMAQASSSTSLKKHPSVHDTTAQERYRTSDFELEDEDYEDDDQVTQNIGVVSDSAAMYSSAARSDGSSLDKVLFLIFALFSNINRALVLLGLIGAVGFVVAGSGSTC